VRWLAALLAVLGTSHASAEKGVTVGVSPVLWVPTAGAETNFDSSLGVRPHFAFYMVPAFAVVASFDYVFLNEVSDENVSYQVLGVGLRVSQPDADSVAPFGELSFAWHDVESESGFAGDGVGLRFAGGATYRLGNVELKASLGYNAAEINDGQIELDAYMLEIGAGWRL
jgi:hypothetical protein